MNNDQHNLGVPMFRLTTLALITLSVSLSLGLTGCGEAGPTPEQESRILLKELNFKIQTRVAAGEITQEEGRAEYEAAELENQQNFDDALPTDE
mgnify:CR=1 FL=1